ncbi:hypothetical protein O181_046588 [Austropuccinia psidii MF-1]|uniref:Tf2-1-like SH3-like domain-containing protein n=1 Tax=Austropuccinia psidii MF-1 TaxID=1389203 RepID=A0A9Q3HIP7_9BASI|nr:hypothetical protein [Austropuccinia psidii MF-1]
MEHQSRSISHNRYGVAHCPQDKLPQHPWRRVITHGCDREKVWLASKNKKTARPTKKPLESWLGPFEVLKKISSHAYHLKLPQQCKSVHPVFHVTLLEPVKQSTIPNQHQFPPPPLIVE